MAALDQSAANVALGQMTNMPFENVIGGPLNAAIKAQALAAQTTTAFIQEVGMDESLNVLNVEFTYDDAAGVQRRVTVPLLAILPIPFIVINTVDINFKAKISASAQQSSQESRSSNFGGRFSGYYRGKRFGASLSASYSAKKDSKASQESRYSVEYTMDVHVHAAQAGMPQGMEAVLNFLQEGTHSVPLETQTLLLGHNGLTFDISEGDFTNDGKSFNILVTDAAQNPVDNLTNADFTHSIEGDWVDPNVTTTDAPGMYEVKLSKDTNGTVPADPGSAELVISVNKDGVQFSRAVDITLI